MSKKILCVGTVTISGVVEIDLDKDELSDRGGHLKTNLVCISIGNEVSTPQDVEDAETITALHMVERAMENADLALKTRAGELKEELGEILPLTLKGLKS